MPAVVCVAVSTSSVTPADSLVILKEDDVQRLRLDFNTERNNVRLLFMLSPT